MKSNSHDQPPFSRIWTGHRLFQLLSRQQQFPSSQHSPMTIRKNILAGLTLGLALGFAGPVSAQLTVLHTWNLDGAAAGQPASDPAVDSTGSIDLGKVGSFNHVNTSNAGVGVALTNGSPNTASDPATTYYHSATDQVTLTSTSNWGFEAWVKMNSAGGEGAVLMIGSEAGGVILQELGVLGNGWAIHIPGLYLAGTASSTVKVGQEQHIAGVIENGQWTIYVDGVAEPFEDIYSADNQVTTPTAGMWIGASPNGGNPVRGMDGDIGAVRIFEFEAGTFDITAGDFDAWILSFPGLSDITAGGDPDGDGISNFMEYVIGGDPRISSTGYLPNQSIIGSNLVLTYKRSDASESDTVQTGQWSTNLNDWTDIAPVLVQENGTDPDDMTISIPLTNAVDGKLFGRLSAASAHNLIGYLPNYRFSGQTLASMTECTDVVYFGNTLGADGTIALGPNADAHLRQIRAGLKGRLTRLILCLGGWGMSEHFPAVTASEESRKRFGQSLASLTEAYEIDGVDLDWEYPRNEQEWNQLGQLIEAGKAAVKDRQLVWSVAVSPYHHIPVNVVKQLDRIHLMTYDAGERHCDPAIAEAAIAEWKRRGVPARKICIGVAFYGRKMNNLSEFMTYADIHRLYGTTAETTQTAGGYYYDNPLSCAVKRELVKTHQLRGLIVWEIGQDAEGDAALLPLLK
jgi:chitinase